MSHGARAKGLAQVIQVSSQEQPPTDKRWQGHEYSESEEQADDSWWRLGV